MTFGVDLPAFFSDFAVTATWGSETASVILDRPDELMLGNDVLAGNVQMIWQSGELVGIAEGDAVVIDGDTWELRETPAAAADGVVLRVSVRKQ